MSYTLMAALWASLLWFALSLAVGVVSSVSLLAGGVLANPIRLAILFAASPFM